MSLEAFRPRSAPQVDVAVDDARPRSGLEGAEDPVVRADEGEVRVRRVVRDAVLRDCERAADLCVR